MTDNPQGYEQALGAVPVGPDAPPAEQAIQRGRDGALRESAVDYLARRLMEEYRRAEHERERGEAATAVGVLALSASATWAERAAQLGLELEAALGLLGESRRPHWEDDERCCPKVYEPDEACTCGADEWNARVDAMLAAWQAKQAAAVDSGRKLEQR